MRTVSFSQLNLLARCPWAWGLQYQAGWGLIEDASPKMALGGLIHDGLALHHMKPQKKVNWEAIRKAADPQPEPEQLEHAAWLVNQYRHFHKASDRELKVLATEYPIAVPVRTPRGTRANYLFIGWIDMITQDGDGRLWIWDHKSGQSFPAVVEMAQDFQLSTYAWGLRQLGAKVGGVVLNLVRTTEKTSKDRFIRDLVPKLDVELDMWGNDLYRRCREIPPPRIKWMDLPKHTGRDCSWCMHYELCILHQTGQYAAVKDMLESDYRKPRRGRSSKKWLKEYNRAIPLDWRGGDQEE